MRDQHIEAVGKGLLIDFMESNDLEPVEESIEVRYDGPHVIIELGGQPKGAVVYGKLMKKFERFIDKHNAMSSIEFLPYTITFYDNNIYISLAQ